MDLIGRTFARTLVAGAMLGLAGGALAADLMKPGGFPKRTVSITVPYGPGGGSDQVARAWSKAMQAVTGVAYQVENKPGGGGNAAMPGFVARPADGYSILEQTDSLMTSIAAGQLPYELGKDLKAVCITQATFSQIYIRPDEKRFTDWKSFVKYAKANAGKVKMANIGTKGSLEHIQSVVLEQAAGIKTRQISFDKPAQRYASLIGGHVDILFEQPGDVNAFLEAKKMKPILTILPSRPSAFPDTPSLTDEGLDSIPVLQRVRGFWVNGKVPADRYGYLVKACEAAFKDKDYQAFNRKKLMHLARSFYNSADALALAKEMVGTYKKYYAELGIKK